MKKKDEIKVCLVGSSGGHLTHLYKRIREKSSKMLCEHIHFSDEVLSIVNKEATSLNISECIGVYIRGTDYVKLKPSGEYVQPSVDQMKCKIHEFENKYNNDIIDYSCLL